MNDYKRNYCVKCENSMQIPGYHLPYQVTGNQNLNRKASMYKIFT